MSTCSVEDVTAEVLTFYVITGNSSSGYYLKDPVSFVFGARFSVIGMPATRSRKKKWNRM